MRGQSLPVDRLTSVARDERRAPAIADRDCRGGRCDHFVEGDLRGDLRARARWGGFRAAAIAHETQFRYATLRDTLRDEEGGIDKIIRALKHLASKHPRKTFVGAGGAASCAPPSSVGTRSGGLSDAAIASKAAPASPPSIASSFATPPSPPSLAVPVPPSLLALPSLPQPTTVTTANHRRRAERGMTMRLQRTARAASGSTATSPTELFVEHRVEHVDDGTSASEKAVQRGMRGKAIYVTRISTKLRGDPLRPERRPKWPPVVRSRVRPPGVGYDIAYEGALTITPELAAEHRAELGAFYETRHGQSGVRCCWRLATNACALEWDGCEKFGDAPEALRSLIANFFAPWGYTVEGTVRWRGEDDATGTLSVRGNVVTDAPDDPEPSVDEEIRSWLALIRSGDVDDRVAAARMLGCAVHGSLESLQAAVDALADALEPAELAVRALETLGGFGESAAPGVNRVLPMLESPSPRVRYWATFALGRMGPAARVALPALERLRSDREDGPRYGALDAIKRLR